MEVVYAKKKTVLKGGVGSCAGYKAQLGLSIDIRRILAKLMGIFYLWIISEAQKFVT